MPERRGILLLAALLPVCAAAAADAAAAPMSAAAAAPLSADAADAAGEQPSAAVPPSVETAGPAADAQAAAAAAAAQAPPPATWSQFGFDSRHSGVNDRETTIHAGNVGTLHLLYHVTLPSIADGAPAYLPQVATAHGTRNLLFLTTKDGRLLALDADSGATVWSARPATGPAFTTSSPAIDPDGAHVYSYGLDGRVHKYQAANGAEVLGGGWPEVATLKPDVEKGSSALAIATVPGGASYLYAANSGYPDDAGNYQGHVTAIDLATGAQHVFNVMCSPRTVHFLENRAPDCGDIQGAIWARPGVVFDPGTGAILFATGNGRFNAVTGGHAWGDSILALRPDGTGVRGGPLDSYTPADFQLLQDQDLDLASSAPAILPVPAGSRLPHLAAQVGKDELVRLLDLDDLSGQGGPGHVGGELQALALPQGNQVLQQPAVWVDPVTRSTWMFIANFNGISGIRLTLDGAGNPSLVPVWTNHIAGTSPLLANGILFYAAVGVGLEALDPRTGEVLWIGPEIGPLHWESPIVVAGRIYMTDETMVLRAYGPSVAPLTFHALPSCRAADTRRPPSPAGGPALSGGDPPRLFQIAGQCGVPAAARAVAANLTVVQPSAAGDLRVGPSGTAAPAAIQFGLARARANLPLLLLTGNPLGAIAVQADLPAAATVGFFLDVYGYFD